jgi:acetylornithine deacetylase/succinyl-diaminopimelate desuccinylase-like protein
MGSHGRLSTALSRADATASVRLRELAAWLTIPSVSGQPAHRADLRRAAWFLAAHLRRAGMTTGELRTASAPVVVGCAAGPPGAPVVVIYGHYDIQPAGPGWASAPFRPVMRGRMLIGRGANDDKGQLFAVVAALRAWREAGGLPSTVVLIAEGAEEIGSPGLRAALTSLAPRVRPDLILACDTEQSSDGVPTITVSQRGQASLLLQVDTGGGPVHAGRVGGAVVDPSLVLAQVLLRMQAALQCGVVFRPLEEPCRPGGQRGGPVIRPQSDAMIRWLAGGRATQGRALDQKITNGSALSVVRMRAGTGRAAVPAQAAARLDVRLPAETNVRAAVRLLACVARYTAAPGVAVQVTARAMSPGFAAVPRPEALAAVDAACRAVYGKPVALVRSGGSLPATRLLAQAFGLVPVLLGLGTAGGGAHGPNERLDVIGWALAVRLLVRLLAQPVQTSTRARPGTDRRMR